MKTILKIMKRSTAVLMLLAFVVSPLGLSSSKLGNVAHAATTWDTTGSYVLAMNYLGTDYSHDLALVQDNMGNLTGNGGSPAGGNTYTYTLTSGTVSGDTIDFFADYTATPDAVTPQTTMHVVGVIAEDGTISGTWSDNYQGGERAGTVTTTSGAATEIPPVTENVMTNPATGITASDATLNGTNGDSAATGHSFWASLNTFSTAAPVLPPGVYSTPDLGPIAANTPFSALLSSVSGLPPITENTTYYFAAWSNVDGTWYPGEVLSFMTTGDDIGGEIGGDVVGGNGTLAVTSIETVDSSATANGTFEDGWKYLFKITIPTDENGVAMKFADWSRTGGGGTIPAANNMRISSAQADNGGATILITAANTYSTPNLNMTTDLDPLLDGIQVEVMVEVAVPVGTTNGSYTTSYGVKTE